MRTQKLIATLAFAIITNVSFAQIKVACIGNSITYGAGIENREVNSYPAQLQVLLGDAWEVENFGVSGATMLKKGDKPYWEEEAWQGALKMVPDVVVIKLGTNDSKPQNWDRHSAEFRADYIEMIEALRAVNENVIVFVCLPVPAYEVRWGIREKVITDEVIPITKRVRKATKAKQINLYRPLSGHEEMFPDKIHPNAEGSGVMAAVIAKKLSKVKKKVTR